MIMSVIAAWPGRAGPGLPWPRLARDPAAWQRPAHPARRRHCGHGLESDSEQCPPQSRWQSRWTTHTWIVEMAPICVMFILHTSLACPIRASALQKSSIDHKRFASFMTASGGLSHLESTNGEINGLVASVRPMVESSQNVQYDSFTPVSFRRQVCRKL
jgi:hypothetical protein